MKNRRSGGFSIQGSSLDSRSPAYLNALVRIATGFRFLWVRRRDYSTPRLYRRPRLISGHGLRGDQTQAPLPCRQANSRMVECGTREERLHSRTKSQINECGPTARSEQPLGIARPLSSALVRAVMDVRADRPMFESLEITYHPYSG